MNINGQAQSYECDGRTLLVEFIRSHCGLTGTHIGCDTSQCGACTVLMNGHAVKACAVLAASADGADIKTIEGMANPDGTLHPIQQAFKECHGLQCGFCTPGMIMATDEILRQNPQPTSDEIRHLLEGNICRCTGYHNIVKSVEMAGELLRKP